MVRCSVSLMLLFCLLLSSSSRFIQADRLKSSVVGEEDVQEGDPDLEQGDEGEGDEEDDEERVFEANSHIHRVFDRGNNIMDYFNEYVLEHRTNARVMQHRLAKGELVIIPEAFDPEFADATHEAFSQETFRLEEDHHSDGYGYRTHTANVISERSAFLNQTELLFTSLNSRMFLSMFLDQNCMGQVALEASYHAPGDYDNPKNSAVHQFSVGFVWFLAKDWLPEWGGAFHWNKESPEHAHMHANYNTLLLFRIDAASDYTTTMVSKHATKSKLFAYSGFLSSNFVPDEDEDLDELMKFSGPYLTREQFDEMERLLDEGKVGEKHAVVKFLWEAEMARRFPHREHIFEIDAKSK